MSQFRLQNNVPDIYVSESRDFQLLLRLYDSIFGGLRFDIDGMQSLTDTMHIKNTILPLLATKLGFFSNIDIDDKSLRYILCAIPYFLKYKGSLYGVKQVVNLYLKIMNVKASVLISYSKDSIGNILDHSIQLGSDVTFTNLPLLNKLLNLVLPVGFVVYYYHFASLDTALTAIEETDEIILLGKIISTTQSVLRSYTTIVENTAQGSIASFNSNLSAPLRSLVANIEPVQDLHGYDSPWPAGGGMNLFQTTATSKTQAGVTWTVNADGSITVAGTATGYSDLLAGEANVAGLSETVTINGDISNAGNVVFGVIRLSDSNDQTLATIYSGGLQTTHTVDLTQYNDANKIVVYLKRNNNIETSGTYHIQVVKGTTVPAWTPYSNICPISGWSEVNVWRTGKNLSSVSSWSGHSGVAGVLDTPIPPNTEFTMSGIFSRDGAATNGCAILFGFSDGTDSGWTSLGVNSGRKSGTKTYTKEIVSVKFYSSNVGWADSQNYTLTVEEFQLELGSTATAYEPYSGNQYTIQLGQTVYGGTLDVTAGTLTVDRAMVDMGTLNWIYRSNLGGISAMLNPIAKDHFHAICSAYPFGGPYSDLSDKQCGYVYNNQIFVKDTDYSDAAAFKTAMSGVQLVYELATPITIPLTPTQISTLQGQNNLWADSGDVELTYQVATDTNYYYQTDWVDPRYDIHQPSTVDDDEIIIEAKERLYGAVSIMQLAGSEDEDYIPDFSTSDTYKVGDVVKYSDAYYQCIVDVNVAGSWTGDTNWVELIYYV